MLCPESVLVTGANRGIGQEFVKQFLALPQPPKHVFAGCRSPDAAKDLNEIAAKNPTVKIVKIDLNDEVSIKKTASEVQSVLGERGLNLLVNNAGIMLIDNLDTVTAEAMQKSYATNAIGPLLVVQAFQPLLKSAATSSSQQYPQLSINRSAIINISTGMASIGENGSGNMYSYRAAKAALDMITKSLSVDLKKFGILVTAILPGFVDTDLAAHAQGNKLSTKESVLSMFKVMAQCQGEQHTGKFYHYNGREMAW